MASPLGKMVPREYSGSRPRVPGMVCLRRTDEDDAHGLRSLPNSQSRMLPWRSRFPETIPSHDSRVVLGDRKVFVALRDHFPENCLVYYDIPVEGRYPDFIVVGPDLGLVLLEVKDSGRPQAALASPCRQSALLRMGLGVVLPYLTREEGPAPVALRAKPGGGTRPWARPDGEDSC